MTQGEDFGASRRAVDRDGVTLNLLEAGPDDRPTVVFVHGYPDTSAVWLSTVARLVGELHCVAYDVRGAGESTAPETPEGYRLPYLVDDLVAVLDTVSPKRPVHLVGHDWGSVQCWDAVLRAGSDRRLRGRLASYTSISGPALGHLGAWAHSAGRRGWRGRADLARQAARSWYVGAFQVPVLPDALLRAGLSGPAWVRRLGGLPPDPAPTVAKDAVNGLGLYRANRHRPVEDRAPLHTDLPVQLIVPLRDRFMIPQVYADLPLWCSDLTRRDVDSDHWVMRSHPEQLASWIADFVRAH